MTSQFCKQRLEEIEKILLHHEEAFILTLCVLNLVFSLVAILANFLVIRALWKASSIPASLKMLFLSLAFSDLAVGLFAQLMYGAIRAVIFKMAASGSDDLDFLCPTVLTVSHFTVFFLACASFLNITIIAVDRLVAVFLHLRYQELVTSTRVAIALVILWVTSGLAAAIYVLLPEHFGVVSVVVICFGLVLSAVANIRIYKVVRYHQNQIQSQLQQANHQEMELLRQKKSSFNALFVYAVFIVCYLPHLCVMILYKKNSSRSSLLIAHRVTVFLFFLNSSLNPLVYCWRYREIRQIVKNTVKKIFHIAEM